MSQENIKVAVRVRPLNSLELAVSDMEVAQVIDQSTVVMREPEYNTEISQKYTWAFDKNTTQRTIYDACASQLNWNGNVTIFTYGVTGSGKTFTLLSKDAENPGFMMRAVNQLFMPNLLKEIVVHAQYVEIYNEALKDLVAKKNVELDIREDSIRGIVVSGAVDTQIQSPADLMNLIKSGQKNRTLDSGKPSSKAHSVILLTIQSKEKNQGSQEQIQVSKMMFIDLGGSERGKGKGTKINTSLTVLGNCIESLYEGQQKGLSFVPYRNSKLTRLMKESLGGNCSTLMIACISPGVIAYDESIQTLSYASKVAHILNTSKTNIIQQAQPISNYTQIIEKLQKENQELKKIVSNSPNVLNDVSKAQDSQLILKNLNSRIEIHFNTERELKQQIYLYENEYTKLSVRQDDLQADLQRAEGYQREEADKIRNQMGYEQKQMREYKSKIDTLEADYNKQLEERNKILSDIASSGLPQINKDYLGTQMKAGSLQLENMEIKHKEERSAIVKAQQEKQLEILRSQLQLRDTIIKDQKRYLSNQAPVNQQYVQQMQSTQEIIRNSRAFLVHHPVPQSIKSNYFNKDAYRSFKLNQSRAEDSSKSAQRQTPKQPSNKALSTRYKASFLSQSALPTLPILPRNMPNPQKEVPLASTSKRNSIQRKVEHIPSLPSISRDLTKFEYDWQHGGYHLKQEKTPKNEAEKKEYLKKKRYLQNDAKPNAQLDISRSTQKSFYDYKHGVPSRLDKSRESYDTPPRVGPEVLKKDHRILLPGQVHESPYVKHFIGDEQSRKERLQKLNQLLKAKK